MNTRKDILNGIACYAHQQRVIIRVIKRHGGSIHQREFDRIFGDTSRRPTTPKERRESGCLWIDSFRRPRIWPVEKDAYVLGDFMGFGDKSKWLHLTQIMVAAGLLKQSGRLPNVHYCCA
jgi:hypothetical protein